MTKQEAIEILWQYDVNFEPHPAEDVMHAIDMAIEALEQDKVLCLGDLERKCKHCTVKGETTHYCYCDMWNSVVEPDGWCNYGEREEMEGEK